MRLLYLEEKTHMLISSSICSLFKLYFTHLPVIYDYPQLYYSLDDQFRLIPSSFLSLVTCNFIQFVKQYHCRNTS